MSAILSFYTLMEILDRLGKFEVLTARKNAQLAQINTSREIQAGYLLGGKLFFRVEFDWKEL